MPNIATVTRQLHITKPGRINVCQEHNIFNVTYVALGMLSSMCLSAATHQRQSSLCTAIVNTSVESTCFFTRRRQPSSSSEA